MNNDKFLRLTQVMAKTGLARPTIYLKIKSGLFPKQINLGPRSVAWLESEINAWMDDCVMASRITVETKE